MIQLSDLGGAAECDVSLPLKSSCFAKFGTATHHARPQHFDGALIAPSSVPCHPIARLSK